MVALLLIALIAAVFAPALGFPFINYDDDMYVGDNALVRQGLTTEGVRWAFTGTHHDLWHPLTTLSHMLDCSLYGLNAQGHHLTNIILHMAAALLLFWGMLRLTGALWPSAFVAALFAIHPMRVEPVVWISSRKDVMLGVFWMLTLLAYGLYGRKRSVWRYVLVFVCCAGALMTKPMAVTLPFALLLLDYWPLRRMASAEGAERIGLKAALFCFVEKIPLFALAGGCAAINFLAAKTRSVRSLDEIGLWPRLGNAIVSYTRYIGKTIVPRDLAPFYPHPGADLPVWQALAAFVALICATFLVVHLMRRRPYLFTGWFWYVGTLVPVIGIVQTGGYAMADRYAYIPSVGLFIIAGWGVPDLLGAMKGKRAVLAVIAVAALAVLATLSCFQIRHWRSSRALWKHAIAVTAPNAISHNNLGLALLDDKAFEEAAGHFALSAHMAPHLAEPFMNLGIALARLKQYDKAAAAFQRALEIEPESAQTYYNLGLSLEERGFWASAEAAFQEALRLKQDYQEARSALNRLESRT